MMGDAARAAGYVGSVRLHQVLCCRIDFIRMDVRTLFLLCLDYVVYRWH